MATILYYNYDPDTGRYLSSAFQAARYSTTVEPPVTGPDDVAVFNPATQEWTLESDAAGLAAKKQLASEQVRAAYEAASGRTAVVWVPDGDPGTYAYRADEILVLQNSYTTGSVTVTQKTLADETTAQISKNESQFKAVADLVADFTADLITEYDGYLSDIAAAGTVEAVNAILADI